jgi:hypothetical protein
MELDELKTVVAELAEGEAAPPRADSYTSADLLSGTSPSNELLVGI